MTFVWVQVGTEERHGLVYPVLRGVWVRVPDDARELEAAG